MNHFFRSHSWKRIVQRAGLRHDSPILLHIGCGGIDAPGYINLDARQQPHVHIVTENLFDLELIPDSAVDLIYMCHVLEHVSHSRLHETLLEMTRVLRTGGILRVSVPDFDLLLEIYSKASKNIISIERALMGGQNYPFNFHYCVFNQARLSDALRRAGFSEVRSWDPSSVDHHDFEDWSSRLMEWEGQHYPVSLNLEGVK